jgi:SPP1 gp7 family putative phage head morphogenesis protein
MVSMADPQQGASYSAEVPNANQQLLDSAIYQGLGLERVNAGMAQKINQLLVDAQEQITAKVQSGKLTDWQAKKAQQFLDWSNKVIANTYDKIDNQTQEHLDGIKRAEIQKQINSVNSAVGVEISPAMSENQLKSIAQADELLVNGAVMKDWWGKQAGNLQHQLLTTVQGGLVQGKSTQDIAKDIKAFMPTADDLSAKQVTAQANALARTAAATVQSEAQKKYYEQNDDIIKGIRWVSTLDSRTTPMCMALDGKTWKYGPKTEMEPVGHDVDFPGYPPIHWNCRSTTVPVLKSWQELSKKELPHLKEKTVEDAFHESLLEQGFTEEQAADIEMNQRASVDGQVPESMTYEEWLKKQPELTQKQILGPNKWQLWNDGKVDLVDMINKETLEPLTVDELVAAAEKNTALPPPPPPPDGMHGLSLAERNILTAQMTSEATSGETWASWLNPDNGVTVDQTLKYTLNPQEAAQLQAQDNLIHLSNTADNGKFWQQSDAKLWAGQDGFTGAKLVTPSGRVITAKLKPGKEWTVADADKYAAKLREAQMRGMEDEFRAQKAAFDATGKMTLTQTEPGAVKLDSSTMKKVYGPVHAEDKPLSYLEAHANLEQLQKDKELADAHAAIKEQLKKADEAQQAYAEESQKAREAQAELQSKIAQRDLAAAEQGHREALDALTKQQKEAADLKAAVDELEANRLAALRAKQLADDELAAAEADQKAAEEKAAKAKKKSEAAKKAAATKAANKAKLAAAEAQAKAEALASWDARITASHRQLDLANEALQAEIAKQANAEKIYKAQQADLEAKKAQQAAIKKQKAEAKAAAKAAKVAAAPVNTIGQMELSLEPKADAKSHFPADPMSLKVLPTKLGGSTGAQLVEDADGNKYVRKTDTNKGQVNDEFIADQVYAKLGINTPEGKLYSTPQGPVKLTKFIDGGKMLNDYLLTASPVERQRIMLQIRQGFVADAWLANWDVAGLSLDNILVDPNGNAFRIDNGGALRYRGMGSKKTEAQFGNKVTEIDTLRNPATAPQAAKLFKDITDQEIIDQAVKLYGQKDELLAMFPAELRAKMAARLDWLDQYASELEGAKMPMVPAAPKAPTWGSEPEQLQGITESKINGLDLWSDKDQVEDARTLVWVEKNLQGQPETVAQLKLRPGAIQDLEKLLKPLMPATTTAYSPPNPSNTVPGDTFYGPILTAAKNINYHVNDAAYNVQKIEAALGLKPALENLALKGVGNGKAMAQEYLKTISQIENSILGKATGKLIKIPELAQYEIPQPKPQPLPVVPTAGPDQWKITVTNKPIFKAKTLKDGDAQLQTKNVFDKPGRAVIIDMGNVQARYMPADGNHNYWSLQGQLEVRTAGTATAETMDRVQKAFKELGIDVTPPSDDYRKSMYLTKNVAFHNKATTPLELQQLLSDKGLTDAERLKRIEEIAKRDFKIVIKPGDERWKGDEPPGGGNRHFDRMDMTRQQIADKMQGYVLTHDSGMAMPELIKAFFNSGGQITATTERLRKGIPIAAGTSPERDMQTGGASYFFTRIQQMSSTSHPRLIFDISHLARLDVYSFDRDRYGEVSDPSVAKTRGTTIADYKKNANNGSNESLFKNGLDVKDIKFVVVTNPQEQAEVIATFKRYGVQRMNDGRPVEQAVILRNTRFPP